MSKKLLSALLLLTTMIFGLVIYVNAQVATPTPPTTPRVDLPCMQTAVEKRDNAIISAWDALSASIKTALETRRDALKSAWGISDPKERRKAIKKAWTDFSKAKKESARTFNQARKAAWKQFRTDAKACRATATNEVEGNDVKF